jgi:hypothetical protein
LQIGSLFILYIAFRSEQVPTTGSSFDAESSNSSHCNEDDRQRTTHHVMGPNLREPDNLAPNYGEFNRFPPFSAIYFAPFQISLSLDKKGLV